MLYTPLDTHICKTLRIIQYSKLDYNSLPSSFKSNFANPQLQELQKAAT